MFRSLCILPTSVLPCDFFWDQECQKLSYIKIALTYSLVLQFALRTLFALQHSASGNGSVPDSTLEPGDKEGCRHSDVAWFPWKLLLVAEKEEAGRKRNQGKVPKSMILGGH